MLASVGFVLLLLSRIWAASDARMEAGAAAYFPGHVQAPAQIQAIVPPGPPAAAERPVLQRRLPDTWRSARVRRAALSGRADLTGEGGVLLEL